MRILTSEQAYFLDKTSIDNFGISSIDLMGNAGRRIALNIEEILAKVSKPKILIICGKGNNGGDGYAAAIILKKIGYSVKIHSTIPVNNITNEALFFYNQCIELKISISYGGSIDETIKADLIIDCILGIGFKGKVRDEIIPILTWVNNTDTKVHFELKFNNGTLDKINDVAKNYRLIKKQNLQKNLQKVRILQWQNVVEE